jgi:hypothetical protein
VGNTGNQMHTSPMVLAVDTALTELVVRECPPPRTGLLTRPSAVLFLEAAAALSALILCWPAASSDSCSSWLSGPDSEATDGSGAGSPVWVGVKTWSEMVVALDACDPSVDRGSLWENAPLAYCDSCVSCCVPFWPPSLSLLLSVRVPLFHVSRCEARDDSVATESEVDEDGNGIE